jgi:xanthine dehydrogenase YagS FAD-binding subunit
VINFGYINAASMDDALWALSRYGEGARLLAGGQDLLFRIKKYLVQPECLINLKGIPGLNSIHSGAEANLRIGALATLSEIALSAELQKSYSVLAQAAGVVASPQIRNLGTLGGNICQDVWC